MRTSVPDSHVVSLLTQSTWRGRSFYRVVWFSTVPPFPGRYKEKRHVDEPPRLPAVRRGIRMIGLDPKVVRNIAEQVATAVREGIQVAIVVAVVTTLRGAVPREGFERFRVTTW